MKPRVWVAIAALAACSHLPHRGEHHEGAPPSPADTVLAPIDDRAAFARLDPTLDQLTDSRALAGNHVDLLIDGVASFARRLANARDADVILVKTFAFVDDETGREVAALLAARARAGAFVVLQYDVTGSIHGMDDVEQMIANGGEKSIVAGLRAAGVQIVPANAPVGELELRKTGEAAQRALFHPFEHLGMLIDWVHRLDFRDHEKYWVTGHFGPGGELELHAIMGGLNVASEYAFGGVDRVDAVTGARGWHDVDAEVTGPIVNDIVARFFDVMDAQLGRPRDLVLRARWNPPQRATGTARVRFVYNHPWFGNRHAIEELYGALIDAVPPQGVIRLETAYFAPSQLIRQHLVRALDRGSRLVVISNLDTSDTAPVAEGTWFAYYALLSIAPRAALFERIARPDLGEVMIHCKVASFGTLGPVIVGSANMDAQSGEHNSEGVLVIEDPAFRARFDAMLETDFAPDRAVRITRDRIEQDSAWRRIRQWAIWQLAWYWL